MESQEIHPQLETFTRNIDALADSVPLVMAVAEVTRMDSRTAFQEYLETYGKKIKEDGDEKSYELAPEYDRVAARKKRNVARVEASYKILPQSFVVSFVSEFDAFLGGLLRVIYSAKPELLNGSERQLKFSELSAFYSIEDAREYILEKEIESILRQSHADQVKALEARFDVVLTKELDVWCEFIELTERRNLYVHAGGIVSNQYRNVCHRHGVELGEEQAIGKHLPLDGKYLSKAYRCLYEIGFKLAHVLWRKLFPEDREKADESLITITYELLVEGRYKVAKKLLDFSLKTIKKHSSEAAKRILIINRAIAYKYSGDKDGANRILDSVDWSALSDDFKLAVAVLKDDAEGALKIMRRIGAAGSIGKVEYKEWPLFRDFRITEEFAGTYKEIFGEEFKVTEQVKSPVRSFVEKHVPKSGQDGVSQSEKQTAEKEDAEVAVDA